MLHYIDENADPCDNFYKFACGGFMNKTIIPADQASVTSYQMVDNVLKQRLREILSEDNNPHDIRAFKLAKNLYKSCMNESKF